MWMGSHPLPRRDKARRVVDPHGKAGLRMRSIAKSAEFQPTLEDLRNVQGMLAREIERLQARHAEITRQIARL